MKNFDGLIIVCMDGRLHENEGCVSAIADELNWSCYDIVTRAGGILDLVNPGETGKNFDSSLLRDIKISVKLHGIKKIAIVGHEDCGAYAYNQFSSRHGEIDHQLQDLNLAKEILVKKFSGMEIILFMATIDRDEDVFVFEKI